MPEASIVEWVSSGTRRPEPLVDAAPLLSSAGTSLGIRLTSTIAPVAGELGEGYSRSPLIFVNLDRHESEACYQGRWTRRTFEPGDITVTPAGMPVAYRWFGPTRGVLLELSLDELP